MNGFIDKSAEENDKRSDVNKQSRISIVKFAGNKSDWVGNDTYESVDISTIIHKSLANIRHIQVQINPKP